MPDHTPRGDAQGELRHSVVHRDGDVVVREAQPWTSTVHALLRHLADVGFTAAPRVGSGFDPEGHETLTHIEGTFHHPGQPTVEAAAAVGSMLRDLHDATVSFRPPPDATWSPWFGRSVGGSDRVIGHGDAEPWNIACRDGMTVALIDWDTAGPVDPLVELAIACRSNANLYSDDIPERDHLPPMKVRLQQLRAMVDAYGMTSEQRRGFVELMVEVMVHRMANDADEANVTPEMRESEALWALAWQARTAVWMLTHRRALERALA